MSESEDRWRVTVERFSADGVPMLAVRTLVVQPPRDAFAMRDSVGLLATWCVDDIDRRLRAEARVRIAGLLAELAGHEEADMHSALTEAGA